MATTGIVSGTLVALYIGGTKIAHLLTNSDTISSPLRSTANKDSGNWETGVPGRLKWGMSGRAHFAFDAGYGYRNLRAAIAAKTLLTVRKSTAVTGDYYEEGTAYLTELGSDYADNENSEFSFTLDGVGALTETQIT